jgi:serine protease AprX
MRRARLTGDGVTVALVDTGVTEVPDLAGRILPVRDDATGKTSACLNLSGEPTCSDSYGHGTFLAGLIAGNGSSSGGAWMGMAPEADIVSIKIAGQDGSADVSTVLAAIQWVVSFKDQYSIRVLNLSLGTDSTQSYRVDPLNYAVERAWAAGVAVVVSASNRGPVGGSISKPADDPWVITVGAVDDRGTPGIGDDHLPNFSGRGPTADGITKPDIMAPGAHMVSLRAPGSAIDETFPSYIDGAYRRGSGTSMAAAVVSGGAALMLQAAPNMSPDRLKFTLISTAQRAASDDPNAVGAGVLDVYQASFAAPPGTSNLGLPRSNGSGSLRLSRGTVLVQTNDPARTILNGLMTAQLLLWDPIGYTTGKWSAKSWYTTTWYLSGWYRTNWHGSNWQGSNWQGSNWQGSTWYGQPDNTSSYGSNWQGSTWYGAWE